MLVTFAPLAAAALSDSSPLGEKWYALAFPTGRRLSLFLNSIALAFAVSITTSVIGLFIALWLNQHNPKGFKWIRWLLIVLIPLPPYFHATAWSWAKITLFDNLSGIILPGGLVAGWVQIMGFLPIAVGASLLALSNIEPDLISAAKIVQKDFSVLHRVVLPLASPMILTASGFIFILSLLDYSVPSLFQYNVYAMEIFADFSAHYHPGRGLILALPLMGIACMLIFLLLGNLRRSALTPPSKNEPAQFAIKLPGWLQAAQIVCLTIFFLQILTPIVSHLALVGSFGNFVGSIDKSTSEIITTLQVCLAASLLCLVVAFPTASKLSNINTPSKLLWGFTLLPLALPSPLVGIGLESIWNRTELRGIYTSNWILVLASAARFLPFAVLLLIAQIRRLDYKLIEASKIYQISKIQAFLRVITPLYRPGFLIAGAAVFVLSLGELGASILVVPPGKSTLTLRIYNYLHYGASDTVAGLSLFVSMIVVTFGLLIAFISQNSSHHFRRGNKR